MAPICIRLSRASISCLCSDSVYLRGNGTLSWDTGAENWILYPLIHDRIVGLSVILAHSWSNNDKRPAYLTVFSSAGDPLDVVGAEVAAVVVAAVAGEGEAPSATLSCSSCMLVEVEGLGLAELQGHDSSMLHPDACVPVPEPSGFLKPSYCLS